MANEATLLIQTEPAIPYTVADGTGIEKGALLKLTDPRTAIISSAQYDPIAGIAAVEKIASDGNTQLGAFKRGRFKMRLSGSCNAGEPVVSYADANYPNYVGTGKGLVAASGSAVFGVFEETGTAGEYVTVWVNVGAGSN